MENSEIKKRFSGLNEKALAIALARHAAVSWIEVQKSQGLSLEQCYREASQMDWYGKRFAASTLERYWIWFKAEGFDGLMPSGRSDAGKSRVLTPEFTETLKQRRRDNPRQSVKELMRALKRDGLLESVSFGSMASIYRYLRRVGLDDTTLRLQGTNGPTKAFETAHVNELWMTDVMYGPTLNTEHGKKIKTRLIAFIDDASRMIPYAQYRKAERESDFWNVLLEAMDRRGVPQKLYTDNGKIFTSLHTQAACARLGIKLCHAKPYAAWSKGKIERWFKTLQDQFQSRLMTDPVNDLEQLNLKLWQWIESEYHQRKHEGLKKSPQARFLEDQSAITLLDREKLEGCFWQQLKRRVRRDATVQWRGVWWEVPVFLRGMEVILRYNPFEEDNPAEVWHDNKLCGTLSKLDREINSRTFSVRQMYE